MAMAIFRRRSLSIIQSLADSMPSRRRTLLKVIILGDSGYETLRMEMPYDEEIAESLFQAQVELKKSRGEVVEEISSLEELKTALNRPGVSFVYFYRTSDEQCKQLCVFMDALSIRYPSLHFLKIEKYPAVGDAERVGFEPTFKIYKHGARRMEIVCPCQEMLENSVIQYNR